MILLQMLKCLSRLRFEFAHMYIFTPLHEFLGILDMLKYVTLKIRTVYV